MINTFLALSPAVTGILVVLALLLFFGAIVFGVIMLKRHSRFFKKDDKKPTEQEIVKQELNRVLEDVKDEETIKAMKDFQNTNVNQSDVSNEKKDNDKNAN